MPIEELLFDDSISPNRTDVYANKGFHTVPSVNGTNRKIFRLFFVRVLAHQLRSTDAGYYASLQHVRISDSSYGLDIALKLNVKWWHIPSVARATRQAIRPESV